MTVSCIDNMFLCNVLILPESVRRVGELSCLFSDAGTITVVSLVSPYKDDRDAVRKRHSEQGIKFLEVFMDVPLTVVQERDPKGLYKKVAAGLYLKLDFSGWVLMRYVIVVGNM